MGEHRDAFTKVGLERMMNSEHPDVDFFYAGCANSQVFGSNVLIWTAGSPMTMTWSFPNPNYPPDQEAQLYLTFDGHSMPCCDGYLANIDPMDDVWGQHGVRFDKIGEEGTRLESIKFEDGEEDK
jgi:hypothetical protein